jgi:hypothetical protein
MPSGSGSTKAKKVMVRLLRFRLHHNVFGTTVPGTVRTGTYPSPLPTGFQLSPDLFNFNRMNRSRMYYPDKDRIQR